MSKKEINLLAERMAAESGFMNVLHEDGGPGSGHFAYGKNGCEFVPVHDPVDAYRQLRDDRLAIARYHERRKSRLDGKTSKISENTIDNADRQVTIKSKENNSDGGPGSGRYPKGSGKSKFSAASYRKEIVGTKTSDGRRVKSISKHLLDRAMLRDVYPESISTALKKGKRTDGNRPNTSVYEYRGTKVIVKDDIMQAHTVIFLGKEKK